MNLDQIALEVSKETVRVLWQESDEDAEQTLNQDSIDFVQAFAHRLLARLESEGWFCVPKEPTQRMKEEGQKTINRLANDGIRRHWQDVYGEGYLAMLAAAPKIGEGE